MTFGQAVKSCFTNYVTFSGRAPRSEYWYWVLFAVLVGIVTGIMNSAVFPYTQPQPISTIASVIMVLPGLAVGFRRLHDIDRTAWWFLIGFTGIGLILPLVWACFRGTSGPNRFGRDPLALDA